MPFRWVHTAYHEAFGITHRENSVIPTVWSLRLYHLTVFYCTLFSICFLLSSPRTSFSFGQSYPPCIRVTGKQYSWGLKARIYSPSLVSVRSECSTQAWITQSAQYEGSGYMKSTQSLLVGRCHSRYPTPSTKLDRAGVKCFIPSPRSRLTCFLLSLTHNVEIKPGC